MSLPIKHLYEFGEFCLDTKEKILMRGDEQLELTPKAFELLTFFVENHGRLLKKDEIMEKIWADSFVEESNLTFNIGQIRKALGDDAQQPIFIKTVRQHGYRFIATVTEKSRETLPVETIENLTSKPTNDQTELVTKPTEESFSQHISKPNFVFIGLAILLISGLAGAFIFEKYRNKKTSAAVLSNPFASEKLTTNGKVIHAILSPDGKKVIYVNGTGRDKESVWLRELETGSNIEIIPPSDNLYGGLAISPDGNFLYFARHPRLTEEAMSIYRISIIGGIPQKILDETQGWMSISPDGQSISFVRCPHLEQENCSLWISDVIDGKNQKKLVTRPRPFRISGNRISPDGKTIAFAVGQSENAGNEFGLSEINLESGLERELTSEKFFNIRNLDWLPDQSGWVLTASRIPNKNSRIWQVSANTGEAVPLTNDSESYGIISFDKNATKLISTQFRQEFYLKLINLENSTISQPLADATTVAFAPDGTIYFTSLRSGNEEIWRMNEDGSNLRQLTNSKEDEGLMVVSPDNNFVFFTSNRTGSAHIWRMNTDGSDQKQLTTKEGGFPMLVSDDGEWVYYLHGLNRTLWRVSIKTGEEQLVLDKTKLPFSISPNGLQIAYSEKQNDESILILAKLANGEIFKTFHLADKKSQFDQIVLMPDEKSLAYVTVNGEFANKALWIQAFNTETPRKIVDLGDDDLAFFPSSISPDGKTIAIAQGNWQHDAILIKGLK